MFTALPSTERKAPSPAFPTVMKLNWNTMPKMAKEILNAKGSEASLYFPAPSQQTGMPNKKTGRS